MRVFALMAAFVAALIASAAMETAEARRGGGGHGHGHARAFAAPRFHAPHVNRYVHAGPRVYRRHYVHTGPRYVSDRCAWLRHRALATGSRAWRQRYHACRSGLYN